MISEGKAGTGAGQIRPAARLRPRALGALIIPAILMVSAACGEKNTYMPPPPPKVTVNQPVKQPVTNYLEFTGNTQAINTVQLKARVEGYLEQVYFKDGDRVKKGQLLFLIQPNTYEAKLKQAEAEILSQKAKLFHAQTEYARFTKLVTQKAAAQTDVDNWLYQRDAAQAAVMSAEAQRDLARLNLSYTKVTSPFDGRIGRRLKDPGNLVGAGEATLLADVDQIAPLHVYFTINERDLLDITRETKESVDAVIRKDIPLYLNLANEEGYPHQGSLDFASISLNATTGTLTLRGVFPNPQGMMLPGLFARLRVPVTHDKSALLVPTVAIGFDQLGPYLLLVDDKNVVQRRGVKLGAEVKDLTVITEGLKEQEWAITNGLLLAIPGKQVTPVKTSASNSEQPPAPAPGGQLKKAAP
ncbi:MAG: efflux RND transporter periplasmic adaptor subunit [Deltaproteobacteria bacterium]|nr:efflux RND transporter periplasmic adaptor subunit [Deltaproteobacteria bacterium]